MCVVITFTRFLLIAVLASVNLFFTFGLVIAFDNLRCLGFLTTIGKTVTSATLLYSFHNKRSNLSDKFLKSFWAQEMLFKIICFLSTGCHFFVQNY